MASKGKKAALAMRKRSRVAKAKKVGDEVASALSHVSESDSIENGDPASTLQNDEAASTSISDTVPKFDPTAAIQRSFRADLNVYLTRSPAELELAQSALLHQLSLITEAKALKDIPGGKLEKFIFFNKFPTEVQKLVWEQLLEHEQKVFMIEAFRTKTQHKSHKKIVNFRCSSGKLDILLTICAGSREVALKHRGLAVGGDLPGFKGLIYMDAEKDIVLLTGTKDAFRTIGMMKGVKKILFDDVGRDCMFRDAVYRRWPSETQEYLAEAIIQFFPDLTEMYFGSTQRDSFSVIRYIKSPAGYKLVPNLREDDHTMNCLNVQDWTLAWAKLQKSLGGESVCPEVKIMWVLKRSED